MTINPSSQPIARPVRPTKCLRRALALAFVALVVGATACSSPDSTTLTADQLRNDAQPEVVVTAVDDAPAVPSIPEPELVAKDNEPVGGEPTETRPAPAEPTTPSTPPPPPPPPAPPTSEPTEPTAPRTPPTLEPTPQPTPQPTPPPEPTPTPNTDPEITEALVDVDDRLVTVSVTAIDVDGDAVQLEVIWPDGAIETLPGPQARFVRRFRTDVHDETVTVVATDLRGANSARLLEVTAVAEMDVRVSDLTVEADALCFKEGPRGEPVVHTLTGHGALAIDTRGHSDPIASGGTIVLGSDGPVAANGIPFRFESRRHAVFAGIESVASVEVGANVVGQMVAELSEDIEIRFQRTFTTDGEFSRRFVGSNAACGVTVSFSVDFTPRYEQPGTGGPAGGGTTGGTSG